MPIRLLEERERDAVLDEVDRQLDVIVDALTNSGAGHRRNVASGQTE
jgi:hypothetical protein